MEEERDAVMKNSFQEPQKRFWMRSRKRRNSDAASISSMDISVGSETIKKKKRRRITEVASNFFSSSFSTSSFATPNKTSMIHHTSLISQTVNADSSILGIDVDSSEFKRAKNLRDKTNGDKVPIRSWIVEIARRDEDGSLTRSFSRSELKRQEAIYELYCGEDLLVRDLQNLQDIYYKPLLNSNILTSEEITTLFGDISALIDLHVQFRDKLVDLRDESGYSEAVGPTIMCWIGIYGKCLQLPNLAKIYVPRCQAQVWARYFLESKRSTNKRLDEFLKKRTNIPRAIDLWTYLDMPRSRVVKYPLLVKEILRHTPSDHADQNTLKQSSDTLRKLLQDIDQAMGASECKLAQSRLNPSSIYDEAKLVNQAKEIISEGQLKDPRGTKFRCFLFDSCFVLARPMRRSSRKFDPCFPVLARDFITIGQPIEVDNKSRSNSFKVNDHILIAEDEHSKRHWLESFRKIDAPLVNVEEAHPRIDSPRIATPRMEKENLASRRSPRFKNAKQRSSGDLCNSNFPITLRKSLLRDKRNSIGLV